jgi:hypothetical protein
LLAWQSSAAKPDASQHAGPPSSPLVQTLSGVKRIDDGARGAAQAGRPCDSFASRIGRPGPRAGQPLPRQSSKIGAGETGSRVTLALKFDAGALSMTGAWFHFRGVKAERKPVGEFTRCSRCPHTGKAVAGFRTWLASRRHPQRRYVLGNQRTGYVVSLKGQTSAQLSGDLLRKRTFMGMRLAVPLSISLQRNCNPESSGICQTLF